MEILIQLVLLAAVVASLALVVVGLPGTVLILITAVVYGFATDFVQYPPWFLAVLLVMSAFAETADNLIGIYWAKRSGSSWWGVLGSIIGAIAGAAFGSALMPVIGTILGGLLGSFAGAFLFEYRRLRDRNSAAKAGWGAFAGRTAGIALKLIVSLVMAFLLLQRVF